MYLHSNKLEKCVKGINFNSVYFNVPYEVQRLFDLISSSMQEKLQLGNSNLAEKKRQNTETEYRSRKIHSRIQTTFSLQEQYLHT